MLSCGLLRPDIISNGSGPLGITCTDWWPSSTEGGKSGDVPCTMVVSTKSEDSNGERK